jgi:O-antigen/teichoic acid export membrane protein
MGAVALGGTPLDGPTVTAILLLMAGMVFSGLGQGVAGLFYAFEKAEIPAAIATVTTILKVGFGVVALLLGYGFVGLAAVSIVVNVATLIILLIAAWRELPLSRSWPLDWPLQWRMVRLSYPLMLNHFFAVIFFQIDVPLLQQFNGEAVVGWYNSAYKWVNAANVIPSFFTFALFPIISRQAQSSAEEVRRTFRISLKLLVLVALPIAAGISIIAEPLIGVLGGAEFLPHGAIALRIVIWSIPFGWINSVTNYVLIALGRERVQTRAFLLGVAFNLVANLLFLPRYSYVAAAIITILSEIVLLVIFNHYLRPKMAAVGWLGLLWRPALAGAIMVGLMAVAWLLYPPLSLVAGLVAYPAALYGLRVFGDEERQIVNALLPARMRRGLALGNG